MKTMPNTKAIIGGWINLPKSQLVEGEMVAMRRHLTFMPRQANSDEFPEPVLIYEEDANWFKIPIATPRDVIPDGMMALIADADYDLSHGAIVAFDKRPDPNHPAVKDPEAQKALMEDMLTSARSELAFVACASTGTGKTVCALNTIAELGMNALVIVPTEYLAKQWIESAKMALGCTDADIGRLQGSNIDIVGKKIVISIINSASMKEYPSWVYSHFGTIIVDEAHRSSSRVFSQAVPRFNARNKIGLSATPKRKDGSDKIMHYHLGQIHAQSSAKALFTKVHALNYTTRSKVWGKTHSTIVKCLTLDQTRNNLIVKVVMKLYSHNRQILVVSDSIKHLQNLMSICEDNGIPRSVMGQFTGQRYLADGKTQKVKPEELEYIKQHSQIIFATYQMMKEGVDIPRLDAGIDATPRTDAIQLVGRIRRPYKNKPKPVWYTIIDRASGMLVGYYRKRRLEYVNSNMEVEEHD